jgi:hypothetical protein
MRQLALVALVGCSIATTGAPRRYDGRVAPDCTTSKALPSLDLTVGLLTGVLSLPLLLASEDCERGGDCDTNGPKIAHLFGGMFLVAGGLFLLSSYAGFSNVSSCRAAVKKHEAFQPPPATPAGI